MRKRLITVDAFRSAARSGEAPAAPVMRAVEGDPQPATDGSRVVRFCFSSGMVDRYGDTIDQKGWRLDGFGGSPVALWSHDAEAPPIGKALNVGVVGDKLMGDIDFAPPETYGFADTIYRLTVGGYLRAVSVGFRPIRWKFAADKQRQGGIDFLEQELLEISVVGVPANPEALIAARAAGIDTAPLVEWATRILDGGETILVPRAELEALRKAAKPPAPARTAPPPAEPQTRDAPKPVLKSLWHVAWLAMLLDDLGCLGDSMDWEAAMEGGSEEASAVLQPAIAALGQVLIDMTAAEVAELLAGEGEGGTMQEGMRALVQRAGRVLSAANEKALRECHEALSAVMDRLGGVLDQVAETDEAKAAGRRRREAEALALRHRHETEAAEAAD